MASMTHLWLAAAALAVLGPQAATSAPAEATGHVKPARIEAIPNSPLKKVTLTPKAAQRLDVQIADVRADIAAQRVVPYSAVLYDKQGATWVYVASEPLSFVRHPIVVGMIRGENATLMDGPAVGTKVLTVGVPQVYGAEIGVGH